jgi:hypothetical protein
MLQPVDVILSAGRRSEFECERIEADASDRKLDGRLEGIDFNSCSRCVGLDWCRHRST